MLEGIMNSSIYDASLSIVSHENTECKWERTEKEKKCRFSWLDAVANTEDQD